MKESTNGDAQPGGDASTAPHQPLAGVRVLELGNSVAAPYAAWVLAGLGADVVKVERPDGGDDARQWGRMFPDGSGSFFQALNRDKRSIAVDLRDPAALAWLQGYCVEQVDVVLQNMRPGKADALGLGARELRRRKPALVYCNLWAFGAQGPMRDRPGYDPLMQACGGLMSVTGEKGREPIRVGTSIIDEGTGLWCAIGILSALMRRAATGEGCTVDASLYETCLAWMTTHVATVQVDGREIEPMGSATLGIAPYQAYACADGHLMVAAPNDRLFARLVGALGHPEWASDPRFDSNQNRYRHLDELNRLLAGLLRQHPREHWQAALDAAGVPSAPVRTVTEMMADPQTRALGILQSMATGGPELMGMPLSFDGARPPLRRLAPALGEHDPEIKGESSSR